MVTFLRWIVLGTGLIVLAGCAASYGTVEQDPLPIGQLVPEGYGIVLVAVTGPFSVNYIQLCHSKLGDCQNYHFPPLANDVIALPVPLPKQQMELNSYTLAERAAGYAAFGGGAHMQYGYITMKDTPFDLTSRVVHFHVQIDTSADGKFSAVPGIAVIQRAADKYGLSLTSISTSNFSWPKQ